MARGDSLQAGMSDAQGQNDVALRVHKGSLLDSSAMTQARNDAGYFARWRMQREQIADLSGDVAWHGRAEDAALLVALVGAHCTCVHDAGLGGVPRVCAAHQILADQHTLDHLAFARTVVNRIVDEEWRVSTSASRLNWAEWSAFLYSCAHDQPTIVASGHGNRPRSVVSGRGALVASLLALLLVLGVGSSSIPFDASPGQQIASWQTR